MRLQLIAPGISLAPWFPESMTTRDINGTNTPWAPTVWEQALKNTAMSIYGALLGAGHCVQCVPNIFSFIF